MSQAHKNKVIYHYFILITYLFFIHFFSTIHILFLSEVCSCTNSVLNLVFFFLPSHMHFLLCYQKLVKSGLEKEAIEQSSLVQQVIEHAMKIWNRAE